MLPTANVRQKRVVGKVICLTVKEWEAFIISRHYTWYCRTRDAIEMLIGEDGFSALLEWIEICAEEGELFYVQAGAKILSWAGEIFEYYETNFKTKFDKYILNSISGRGENDMVAIVISASYQSYKYNGRYYKWQRTSLKKAYKG